MTTPLVTAPVTIEGGNAKKDVVEFVRSRFKALGQDMRVFTADPLKKEDIPCVAVNLTYDSEDDVAMDDGYIDRELSADGKSSKEVSSALMTFTCELRLWTENADVRDDLGKKLKAVAVLLKKFLTSEGYGNVFIRGGRDENDFKTYSPLTIYWRVYNVRGLDQMNVSETPDTGAPAITEVDTTVTPVPVNVISAPGD